MPFMEWTENDAKYRLHYLEAGQGDPLILCHGFTGRAENWRPLMDELSPERRIIALDLPGHGATHAPGKAAYTMSGAMNILVHLLDELQLGQVDLLGYSMGGRFALSFACAHPQRLRRLLLESASPGLKTAEERAARKISDDALAERIEREGIPAFVDFWEQLPLWESQRNLPDATRAQLRDLRLRNDPHGLANSLRGMGTGVMPPLWKTLPELTIPTLLLVGELDAKFRAINEAMHKALPDSALVIIPGAGHTIHLEQPAQYHKAVTTFLQKI